jgi:hypothetical protein
VGEVTLAVEVLAVLIGVPAGYAWLGRRARRRGIGGSVLAPLEEIWDPGAHRTNIEIQVLAEREAPAPGDKRNPTTRS